MKMLLSIILMMAAIAALFFAAVRTHNTLSARNRRRKQNPSKKFKKGLDNLTYVLYAVGVVFVVISLLLPDKQAYQSSIPSDQHVTVSVKPNVKTNTEDSSETAPVFTSTGTASTNPVKQGINWEIFSDGRILSRYTRTDSISFGAPEEYFALPGISTYRGNNYRNNAAYGTAVVEDESFATKWSIPSGILPGSSWSGSGWTGQPIIVQWDYETRQKMNLFPEKKAKGNLVEIIYPTLDGCVYFLDLDDGTRTREVVNLSQCCKGSGTLDPRGYPLLYVGTGDVNSSEKRPRMYIISLIDGRVLYEYGDDDPMALRKDNDAWCAFDSSPLVDAETDTVIWPGENGVLYTIKLNTEYNKNSGKISISPDAPVCTRYTTPRTSEEAYWYGYEASPSIVGSYMFISENGGMIYCVDLNTMEVVWAQDTLDDSNSTPAIEIVSETEGYVYTAPYLHWTQDENNHGTINIYKLDAVTGEIIWQVPYEVYSIEGVSGGVHSSPLLGKEGTDLEGLVVYSIARTPSPYEGLLVALDTETGEEVWRYKMAAYPWTSPVAVYEEDGTAYIVVCDSSGFMYLINATTGQKIYSMTLGYLIEASPAIYKNTIVIGTRGQKIWAIDIE